MEVEGQVVRRRVIPMREHEPLTLPYEELLTDGELTLYPEVVGNDYFKIYYSKGELVLQAGSYVGLVPINTKVAIDIRPRVPVSNLTHVLNVAGYTPVALEKHMRGYATQDEALPSLVDSLAQTLLDKLQIIESRGKHHAYLPVVQDTSFPRGRILIGETMRRHLARGRDHVVRIQQFVRSADTGPNRCLKYALWYLAQRYNRLSGQKGVLALLARINRAYHRFDDVLLDTSLDFLKDQAVLDPGRLPDTYDHYRTPLGVARLIIEDRGVRLETAGDEISLASLLVKMDGVFEDYIRAVLRDRLSGLEPEVSVLDGNKGGSVGGKKHLFDGGRRPFAQPDIVLKRNQETELGRQFPVLLDVKYKPVRNAPDRDGLNQVIAYSVSYRCARAMIVHLWAGKEEPRGLQEVGKIGTATFYQYAYNLGAEDLDQEEQDFAEAIRTLL